MPKLQVQISASSSCGHTFKDQNTHMWPLYHLSRSFLKIAFPCMLMSLHQFHVTSLNPCSHPMACILAHLVGAKCCLWAQNEAHEQSHLWPPKTQANILMVYKGNWKVSNMLTTSTFQCDFQVSYIEKEEKMALLSFASLNKGHLHLSL